MAALKMNHPIPADQPVLVGSILVAQGCGATNGSQDVFGVVYSDATGQHPVASGERLPSKTLKKWGLLFRNLPQNSKWLVVYVTISGEIIAKMPIRLGAIDPIYPRNNDVVPQYFYAYGEIDEDVEPTATINTDPEATGILIYGPPLTPGVYLFDFSDVPMGTDRTLTIASESVSHTTITITDEAVMPSTPLVYQSSPGTNSSFGNTAARHEVS